MGVSVGIALLASLCAKPPAASAHHASRYHWGQDNHEPNHQPPTGTTYQPSAKEVLVGDNVGEEWDSAIEQAMESYNRHSHYTGVKLAFVAGRAYKPGERNGCYYPNTAQVCGAPLRRHWIAATKWWPKRDRTNPDREYSDHFRAVGVELNNRRGGWSHSQRVNIMCHELGHVLGLRHNRHRSSCLHNGFTSTTPNGHDLRSLRAMYSHRDA